MTPSARIASAFFPAAISRTTIGISNAPATRWSAMSAAGESAPNSFEACSTSPSTYWPLKRLATIANWRLALEERGRRGASFDISQSAGRARLCRADRLQSRGSTEARPTKASKKMAHLGLLRLEVFRVMHVGFASDRDLLDHLNSVALETDHLLRIIGQEPELAHAEIEENLRAESVITQVGREPEPRIGLDRVETFLL